jgi:hypothetical protein
VFTAVGGTGEGNRSPTPRALGVIKFKSGVAEAEGFEAGDLSRSGDVGKLGVFLVLPGRTGTPLTNELSVDMDETVGEARFMELLDLCCPMLGCFLPPNAAESG